MRGFVVICLTFFLVLPLAVFHLVPESTFERAIEQIEARTGGRVILSYEGFNRGFPAHVYIDPLKVVYSNKKILELDDAAISINPYLFYLKTIGFGFKAHLNEGSIKASGLLSADDINCCVDADSISFKSMELSDYLGAVRDALFSFRSCATYEGVIAKAEVLDIKMKDLPYRDMIFPSSRVRSLELSFRVKKGMIVFDAVNIKADGYTAVFYGTLKGRLLKGTLELYASADMPEDALSSLKPYRISKELYIIPIENLNVVSLLR